MAYEKIQRNYESARIQEDGLASKRFVREYKHDRVEFYEIEPAVVLDIILDETHPAFSSKTLNSADSPQNIDGEEPTDKQPDYSWVGRIKFRFYYSQKGQRKETLFWASPLENTGITEYPLLNEVVGVVKYLENYYYTRKINIKGLINANADFAIERRAGLVEQNYDEYAGTPETPVEGPVSKLNYEGDDNYWGMLGSYFKFNPNIRTLKRYEGDTLVESRFGSSIRFGSYDSDRDNDVGLGEYEDRGGNPYTLIRNRQAPVSKDPDSPSYTNRGYVTESINDDGSSIHLTSGKTISEFVTTCKKVMFQAGFEEGSSVEEEQPEFSPPGGTTFKFPVLDGDQIVINSDRLIFSSKANETFHFSKKRFSMVTDDEFTIDAHKQIVLTTNEMTSINSPMIFLGQAYQTAEPALLGRTTTLWDITLCNWLLNQTNWMIELCNEWLIKHVHDYVVDTGAPDQAWISKMKTHVKALEDLRKELIALRDDAPKNMSKRVFLVGGGGAPGFPGGELAPDSPVTKAEKTAKEEMEKQEEEEPPVPPEQIEQEYETVRIAVDNSGYGTNPAV
jgi:hypothetical protein